MSSQPYIESQGMDHALRSLLERNGDPALHRWVHETVRAFEGRLVGIIDPRERDQARQAALILIRTTLAQWSEKPAHLH